MRIAQVSPLHESVPPTLYGGTERVVSYLTEELVTMGHEVTLFASGDSQTGARLHAITPRALRLDEKCIDPLAHHIAMIEDVFRMAEDFDLIHYHTDYLHLPFAMRHSTPHLTTVHGRLDIPDLRNVYRRFPDAPTASISHAQRIPLPWINWRGTVHHGLPRDLYSYQSEAGEYLTFLGRIAVEKRPDRAIEIAELAGRRLRIAAKVSKTDQGYFDTVVSPLLNKPHTEFIGEIGESEKQEFLGNALALLLPIDWPEPFGLVMIEALACGTPIIAFRGGSVPEIVEHGETGFIVDTVEEAVEAVGRIGEISRHRCRRAFEERFTATQMARAYLDLYRSVSDRPVTFSDERPNVGSHPDRGEILSARNIRAR